MYVCTRISQVWEILFSLKILGETRTYHMSTGSHSLECKFPIICLSRTPTLQELLMLPLADKSARRSKSTEKSHGTAINHFERFLQHINHPRTYETLLAEDVADGTLLGMFRLIYQIQRRSRCEVHMTSTYLGYIIIRLSDQFSLQMKLTKDKYTRLRIAL